MVLVPGVVEDALVSPSRLEKVGRPVVLPRLALVLPRAVRVVASSRARAALRENIVEVVGLAARVVAGAGNRKGVLVGRGVGTEIEVVAEVGRVERLGWLGPGLTSWVE